MTVRPAPGARAGASTRTVRSRGDGRFSLALGRGASRRVEVRYAGNARLASSGAGVLHLGVRAGVILQAAPRSLRTGERLTLRGRVDAGGTAMRTADRRVDLQFLDTDAGRWRPVLSTRTERGGAFSAEYRFRFISGVARIRLRAKVAGEGGWPFAPGISDPVTVHVRG